MDQGTGRRIVGTRLVLGHLGTVLKDDQRVDGTGLQLDVHLQVQGFREYDAKH